jgi:DNA-binding PucR family transcriptional regulator
MIRERLGALMDRDARSGSDLLPTLRAYLDADGHQPTAAAARHIHVSTLKYRLKQIRELVGGDMADPEFAFQLRLAIKLLDLVDAVRADSPAAPPVTRTNIIP